MKIVSFFHLLKLDKPKYAYIDSLYEDIKQYNLDVKNSFWFYQVFPLHSADILIWSSFDFENEDKLNYILSFLANLFYRNTLHVVDVLWGFTKPSIYTKTQKSPQEIDPFSNERKTYLIVYPFVKTAEWYLLKKDTRQGMMNEHIRIGRQYPSILQLLLYCFGLSNHEFIVSYETNSLTQFEELVQELRSSDARKYTLRDTPIYIAIHRNIEDFKNILL
ncbi:MAG: chlorite dismutase family protein [bacterium]